MNVHDILSKLWAKEWHIRTLHGSRQSDHLNLERQVLLVQSAVSKKLITSSLPRVGDRPHLVAFADFVDEGFECLVYVDGLFSRCLDEFTPQVIGKVSTLCATTAVTQTPWR